MEVLEGVGTDSRSQAFGRWHSFQKNVTLLSPRLQQSWKSQKPSDFALTSLSEVPLEMHTDNTTENPQSYCLIVIPYCSLKIGQVIF